MVGSNLSLAPRFSLTTTTTSKSFFSALVSGSLFLPISILECLDPELVDEGGVAGVGVFLSFCNCLASSLLFTLSPLFESITLVIFNGGGKCLLDPLLLPVSDVLSVVDLSFCFILSPNEILFFWSCSF